MLRQVQPPLSQERRNTLIRLASAALVAVIVAFIIVIPFPIGPAMFLALATGLLLLLHPVLLILGLIASVPVQDAIPLPEGIPITATRAMTATAIVLVPLVLVRQRYGLQWSRLILSILAIVTVMVISLWNATDPSAGYPEIYHWSLAALAFWLTLTFVRSRRLLLLSFAVIAILALAQGITGAAQALLGVGPASFEVGTGFSRAYGSFGMPNSYAAYLETVTLPLIPVLLWASSRFWTHARLYWNARPGGYLRSAEERRQFINAAGIALLFLAGTGAGLAGLALSFSRGGWLGTIAALGVMIILLGRRAIILSTAAVLVASLALMIGASGRVLEVIEERSAQLIQQAQIGDIRAIPVTDENFATVERMSHWQTAIAMWDKHPWLGVGVGNYNERFTEFAVHPQFFESQGHAHNYYLHVLAETGLIGLGTYLVFLIATYVIGWRAYRSPIPLARAIGIGAIGLTTALVVHNVFENLHVLNISLQMMFIWALALIASRWQFDDDHDDRENANAPDYLLYDSGDDDRTPNGFRNPILSAREFS